MNNERIDVLAEISLAISRAGKAESAVRLVEARAAVAELIEVAQFDIQRRPDAEGVPAYCEGWCVVDRFGNRRGPWCFDADAAISVARSQIAAALARVGGAA